MGEIIKASAIETKEEPKINSRYAVVYDRLTRKCAIWEKRK